MKIIVSLLIACVLFSFTAMAQNNKKINFSYEAPAGYALLDSASGDLNQDGFRDYIVVLKNLGEDSLEETARPLIILLGNKQNGLDLYARNDSVVYCKNCGGIFGDPYQGITIKKQYFSIDHYGGSSWRWTRNTTFRYDKVKRKFLLHRDGGESYHTSDPDKTTLSLEHKSYYGKLPFEDYHFAL
jgi:hypothetical protein